jgi:hypothetical protein
VKHYREKMSDKSVQELENWREEDDELQVKIAVRF